METLVLDGKVFVKASKAADDLGYTADYVGQLCRSGKVTAHLVGRTWYVDVTGLGTHRVEKKRISRVKAREQAHKAIEAQKKLRVQSSEGSRVVTPIRYEEDVEELIPQVRKVEITEEKKPHYIKASPSDENEPAYQIENEGNKIVMSGTLNVVDLNEETIVDDGAVVLSPRIMRKSHKKIQKPENIAKRITVSSEEEPEESRDGLTTPEPTAIIAAPKSFTERLKRMEEEPENVETAHIKINAKSERDTTKIVQEQKQHVEVESVAVHAVSQAEQIRAEVQRRKQGGIGIYVASVLAVLVLTTLSLGISGHWVTVINSEDDAGIYSETTFTFEKNNIVTAIKRLKI